MKLDGQLEKAQFENVAGTPSATPLARVYADITDTTNAIPRIHDGTGWQALLKRRVKYSSATTTATIGADDEIHRMDASGAAFTSTLPAAASMEGKTVIVQKTDTSFNVATVKANGAELIDGSNTLKLCTYLEWVRLLCISGAWTVIASGYYQGKVSFTPTGAWVANTTYTGYWWRIGDRINIEAHLALTGAPTSATMTVNMPTGTTIDTTKLLRTTAGQVCFGYGNYFDTSTGDNYQLGMYYSSSSSLRAKYDNGASKVVNFTEVAPITVATGDEVDVTILNVPVTDWRG